MTMRFNRRNLLRAAGAGILSTPFLRYGMRSAHANSDQAKRLIVFWTPNGVNQDKFWPSGSGSSFTLSETLAPLAEHKSDLTIIRGVTYSGTGDHKYGKPYSTTGLTAEEGGPSIDQEVASALASPSMVLCGQSKGNVRGYISYAKGDHAPIWPEKNVTTAYETIFGPITGGEPPMTGTPGGRDGELDALILETAMQDVEELRKRLPAAEKVKMDDQLAALINLKKSLMGGGPGGTPIDCDSDGAQFATSGANFRERIRLHMDLIATAFACDARRVASLMFGPVGHDNMGGDLSFISGVGGDIHNNIAHPDPSGQRMADIDHFQASELAYLIDRLKGIPEGSGTVFDNTVILWLTECTHGNHGHRNIPVVVIGSGGGVLKTGQYLDAENGYVLPNVLMAAAHAAGHEIGSFGDKTTGPYAPIMA